MKENLSYEEWLDEASSELVEKFKTNFNKYSDDRDEENFYYGSITFWMSLLK